MRIDAHQHYWAPERGDYGWLSGDRLLDRRYTPADLAPHLEAAGIEATILVQATESVAETEYLLGIADGCASVAAVVGWIDFEDPAHLAHLERFARHPKFRGLRPMVETAEDIDWMLRPDLGWAFRAIEEAGLVFEALGRPDHLAGFARLFERHPGMTAVIDHAMKPRIAAHGPENFAAWAAGMERLAATGAFCKLSGLVTEAEPDWQPDDLRPYTDRVLELFGAERVMWGSDWPVMLRHSDYARWLSAAEALTDGLAPAERDRIFGGTAAEVYRIG